jgi:hypothetical protein
MDRRFLGEKKVGSVKRQIAVDLIGGYLMKSFHAAPSAGLEEYMGSDDVRAEKCGRVFNGTINVTFRREIHDHIDPMLIQHPRYRLLIGDVAFHKSDFVRRDQIVYGAQIARVSQRIQANDMVVRSFFRQVIQIIRADKTRAARDQLIHLLPPVNVRLFRDTRISARPHMRARYFRNMFVIYYTMIRRSCHNAYIRFSPFARRRSAQ